MDGRHTPLRLIFIAGPTASGKSALALRLAESLGGVIVNADSMQIYRDLRVLTARPSADDEARAPHRLYGVLDGATPGSAGGYARMAGEVLGGLAREGAREGSGEGAGRAGHPDHPPTAIVTGGTGLYFRSLTEGLSDIPDPGEEGRKAADAILGRLGLEGAHRALAERDPATAAMVRPTDTQRLIRAWALLETTGRGLHAWQSVPASSILDRLGLVPVVRVVLDAPRSLFHARADARFEAMVAGGALEEVAALRARGLDPGLPVMKAVGVRELGAVLDGTMAMKDAVERSQTATRQYIKRQLTWFRNQMADWTRLDAQDPAANTGMILRMIADKS